jgi:hypothetical protein
MAIRSHSPPATRSISAKLACNHSSKKRTRRAFASGLAEAGVNVQLAMNLARNERHWHHLLELCGLVGAYVIDSDGVHDPAAPNDRLPHAPPAKRVTGSRSG